jgi:hypothetical protein
MMARSKIGKRSTDSDNVRGNAASIAQIEDVDRDGANSRGTGDTIGG